MTGTEGWFELRVRAPAERCPGLLTEVIGPFLTDPDRTGARPRGHFVPDWERGLVSVFLSAGQDRAERWAELLSSRLRAHCAPGEPPGLELVPGARTAIHEVQMTGPEAQELVDGFLIDSSPFVLSLLSAVGSDAAARAAVAFDLMVCQPLALRPLLFEAVRDEDCPLAFISYRSHVDGFFIMSKDPAATRRVFEDRFARTAGAMARRLAALVEQLTREGRPVSLAARDWAALLQRMVPRIQSGLERGTLTLQMEEGDGYLGDHYDLGVSPFHQLIDADPLLRARAARDVDFNVMRVLASLLYLTLHRLGLRFIERYLLCYAVARTFESVFALEPAEAMARFSRVFER
jgi:hypothetical protein